MLIPVLGACWLLVSAERRWTVTQLKPTSNLPGSTKSNEFAREQFPYPCEVCQKLESVVDAVQEFIYTHSLCPLLYIYQYYSNHSDRRAQSHPLTLCRTE